MGKLTTTIALFSVLILCMGSSLFAGNPPAGTPPASEPIQFPKGSTQTTMSGSVGGNTARSYSVTAIAGQTLTVRLDSSGTTTLSIINPAGKVLVSHVKQWKGQLPVAGVYKITLETPKSAAGIMAAGKFRMLVDLQRLVGGPTTGAGSMSTPANH